MSTVTRLAQNFSTTGAASHATSSISAAAGSSVLLGFTSQVSGQTASSVPTVTGCSLTWAKQAAADFTGDLVLYLYVGVGTPSTGAVTVTHDGGDSVLFNYVLDELASANTTTPVVQAVGAAGSSATALATLAAFSGGSNGTYGVAYSWEDAISSVGSGFTNLGEFTGSFGGSMRSQWRSDNDTTVDMTMATDPVAWGIIGAELSEPTSDPTPVWITYANLTNRLRRM